MSLNKLWAYLNPFYRRRIAVTRLLRAEMRTPFSWTNDQRDRFLRTWRVRWMTS